MQVTKSEKFIKAEDLKDATDTKFKILDEPVEVAGQYGKKLECRVKVTAKGQSVNARWSINNTSKNSLIDKFGAETSEWIGKEFNVYNSMVSGKETILVK